MRALLLTLLFAAVGVFAREYHDPAGFRVDLPQGWQAVQSKAGHFIMVSPDPQHYVFVQPVLNRTTDCAATLRQALSGSGSQFAGVQGLDVSPAGRGLAVARFLFQNGQVRGEMMCAETSRRGGTFYGLAAPVQDFARELPMLVSVLKSFSFEAASRGGSGGTNPQMPQPALVQWQEPNELAYTIGVPQGWQVTGGLQRMDVSHYNSGVFMTSPDGASTIRLGDPRVALSCLVAGPGMASMPGANTVRGMCQMQNSQQFGVTYIQQFLARDLGLMLPQNGLEIQDRPDLSQRADQMPRSMGINVQTSTSEIRFRGTRNGTPVAGTFLAVTSFTANPAGGNVMLGSLSFGIRGFVGSPQQFGMLARLTGAVGSSVHWNPVWFAQTNRISQQEAAASLAASRQTAENQQQAFWDRMGAADRRSEAVGDVLRGTVRLSDGQGNQYEAKAGSNYYFRDDDAARTAGRPDDAVTGSNLWPSSTVDLSPLQVIR